MSCSVETERSSSEFAVFTIGHSTHDLDEFLELLNRHGITAIGDVRSSPYSRMNPQFNRETLRDALVTVGVTYAFLGRELGARSDDPSCIQEGKVSYDRIAQTDLFQDGLRRALQGAQLYRLALMCAEKEPLDCHRTILVARHIAAAGASVNHILADGSIEFHEDTMQRLLKKLKLSEADLFRSRDQILNEAYERQGGRIAYQPDLDTEPGFDDEGV